MKIWHLFVLGLLGLTVVRATEADLAAARAAVGEDGVQGQVQGFTLRSAVTGGRDILDFPLEVKPNEDVADIAVTMTTQSQELSGSLLDNTGNPATDYTVIVFPAESQYWTPQSRRIVSARPGTDGKFFARNLPTGEYLIAAVTDVEPGEHMVIVSSENKQAVKVNFEAGKVYPFLQNVSMGVMRARVVLACLPLARVVLAESPPM